MKTVINKKNISKTIFLFFCFGIINQIFSQDTYSVSYEYITLARKVLPSKLVVSGNESAFKILDERKRGWSYREDGSKDTYVVNDELSTFSYSDGKISYVRIPSPKSVGGAIYKYGEDLLNWQITGNTKKIREYNCQEATVELLGRSYQVWFTTEIPISKGPLKLHGLPGLIVEVVEKNKLCKIRLIDVKKTTDKALINSTKKYFDNNKVMTFEEYEELVKDLVIRSKIKIAKYKSETIMQYGGTLDYEFPNGNYYFVRRIIDIPKGTIEELEK